MTFVLTRSEREYLAKGIVQHYVNIADRQKKDYCKSLFTRTNTTSNYISDHQKV